MDSHQSKSCPARRSLLALNRPIRFALCLAFGAAAASWAGPLVSPNVGDSGRQQRIDGFGTCTSGDVATQSWFQDLYYNDLRSSIVRADMTPRYKSPYSDWTYNTPWFHFNPFLPGPDGNNVRTYTGPNDYSREYFGRNTPLAVMGPDIEQNIQVFDYEASMPRGSGVLAAVGTERADELGGFKLLGCFWSPAPWVKVASGNVTPPWYGWPLPVGGTPWPYVWFDNFAGGKLDISNEPLEVFNDGTGPTSALTQYARSCAAYILGYQRHFGVKFYAVSIQNEPGFEQFFNSCTYPLSHQYITAMKALRAEFDKHEELKHIVFSGTDDLLGGDPWGLWQYGGGDSTHHKNLQYLANIEADSEARQIMKIYAIHGYAADGVNAANANPIQWSWWANGWNASPAPGLPSQVAGFTSTGKKSWMTETSGEDARWLWPESGFPGDGAWSVALRIHQALTTGRESAWLYWQLADGGTDPSPSTLTGSGPLASSPKYNAAKHFFRHIRPGAQRVDVSVENPAVNASAYVHDGGQTITYVLLNTTADAVAVDLAAPVLPSGIAAFDVYTSSNGSYWTESSAAVTDGKAAISIPGYGVVTVVGNGTSASIYADALATGWTQTGAVASDATTHWQSEAALAVTTTKHAVLQLTNASGAVLGENDLLQFHVRATSGTAEMKKIQLQVAGVKTEATAKKDALYLDDQPLNGKKVSIPADGGWHKVMIDLEALGFSSATSLSGIEIAVEGAGIVVDDVVLFSL